MIGWIEGVFRSGASAVAAPIVAMVRAVIRGVYGFIHDIFRLQWDAWNWLWNGAHAIANGIADLDLAVFRAFAKLFRHLLPAINVRITVNNVTINKRVDIAIRDYNTKITNETRDRKSSILALLAWIIAHVLNPLSKLIAGILSWIAHEGAMMLHYFTHLTEFAELLFWFLVHSLEKHAWDAARLLGTFMLALIVRNLMTFVKLSEDIIDAVL